jgi:hypothetical protein
LPHVDNVSRRILVNEQQPHGAKGMPAKVFQRIIGSKSEQNSSHETASKTRIFRSCSATGKHPQQRIILHDQSNVRRFAGDAATTSMIENILKRNITDRALFRLIGQSAGHPKAMRLQVRIKSFGRQLSEVRC